MFEVPSYRSTVCIKCLMLYRIRCTCAPYPYPGKTFFRPCVFWLRALQPQPPPQHLHMPACPHLHTRRHPTVRHLGSLLLLLLPLALDHLALAGLSLRLPVSSSRAFQLSFSQPLYLTARPQISGSTVNAHKYHQRHAGRGPGRCSRRP